MSLARGRGRGARGGRGGGHWRLQSQAATPNGGRDRSRSPLIRHNRGRGGQMKSTTEYLAAVRDSYGREIGLTTTNRYSNSGLRSNQSLKEPLQQDNIHMFFENININIGLPIDNNTIRSQTFNHSRNNSLNAASQSTFSVANCFAKTFNHSRNNSLNAASQSTFSVANCFAKKLPNSVGNARFLNKQGLVQVNNQFGGYNQSSDRSNRANQSNSSRSQNIGLRQGRGGNRRLSDKFVNNQILNPELQEIIAAIQGKSYGNTATIPGGVENFYPTPYATKETLDDRFAYFRFWCSSIMY